MKDILRGFLGLFQQRSAARAKHIRPRYRPFLELLEDRLAPAVLTNEIEPNDNIAHANDITGNFAHTTGDTYFASVQGVVNSPFEYDFFRITASPGDQITLEQFGNSLPNPYLRFFNNAGTLLAFNDDYFGLHSHISYTFGDANSSYRGDYYVVASAGSSALGSYTLNAQLITTNATRITTHADPDFGQVGSTVLYDTATLSGGTDPTGTITFTLYAPNGAVAYTETVPVDGNGDYSTSTGVLATQVGFYQWVAEYSGDENNFSQSSVLGDDPVEIDQTGIVFFTTPNWTSANVGDSLTTTATTVGGYNLSGSITFTLYYDFYGYFRYPVFEQAVPVSGNGVYSAFSSYQATEAGLYTWAAEYSGDNNNRPKTAEEIAVSIVDPADGYSVSQSAITVTPTSIPAYGTTTVTLTARNSDSIQLAGGGLNIEFALGAGSSIGYFDAVTDNNNGTYTANFHANFAAGSNTITATINGQPVTSAGPLLTVLSSPRGSIATDRPTFSWTAVAGAVRYDIWVEDLSTGQKPVLRNANVTGIMWTPSAAQALTPGHNYKWYLGVVNATGVTTYDAGQTFNIATLAAPTRISPAGAVPVIGSYDRPTFTWSPVAMADHYYLQVVDNTTGRVVINNPNVGNVTSIPAPTALTPGHSFTWYLAAVSTNGQAVSYLTTSRDFTLATLAEPMQTAPLNTVTAATGYDKPTFTWNAVAGADHYYLVVVDNTTGATVIRNPNVGNVTSFPADTVMTPGHRFTWYLAAISTNGQAVSYLTTGKDFTLTTLAEPMQTAPLNTVTAATGYDKPTFTWDAVAGTHHYYVVVVDNTTGATVIRNPNVGNVTSFPAPTALTPGHNFTWYVAAVSTDSKALSYLATGRDFTLAALDQPTQTAPLGNITAATGYDKPTFTWNAVAGADHYYLVVVDNTTRATIFSNPNVGNVTSFPAPTALTPGHNFTWYVAAVSTDSKALSYLTTGRDFTLAALGTPMQTAPLDTIFETRPTFTWMEVPGARHYYLYLFDDTANVVVIDNPHVSDAGTTTFVPGMPLTIGHRYTWYLAAVSTDGLIIEYDSKGRMFQIS